MYQINKSVLIAATLALSVSVSAAPQSQKQPPKGFTSLFNGKDLGGWRGRQPNYNPAEEAKLSQDEHKQKQTEWDAARDQHWASRNKSLEKHAIAPSGARLCYARRTDNGPRISNPRSFNNHSNHISE